MSLSWTDAQKAVLDPGSLFSAMKEHGILLNLHYIPIYRQPYFQKLGFDETSFPNAEKYYAEAFSIPMYAGLQESDQNSVISSLLNVLSAQ